MTKFALEIDDTELGYLIYMRSKDINNQINFLAADRDMSSREIEDDMEVIALRARLHALVELAKSSDGVVQP